MNVVMNVIAFKDACHHFAEAAAPYLCITDEQHYQQTLELIEGLLEEAEDSATDPLNAVIDMLSQAIETYENQNHELLEFSRQTQNQPIDIAILRLLMDQYQLGTADLPEIGSKSMVSRVLNGERSLSKKHIQALSERFLVNPGLFF